MLTTLWIESMGAGWRQQKAQLRQTANNACAQITNDNDAIGGAESIIQTQVPEPLCKSLMVRVQLSSKSIPRGTLRARHHQHQGGQRQRPERHDAFGQRVEKRVF
jgi:hypothetical protein